MSLHRMSCSRKGASVILDSLSGRRATWQDSFVGSTFTLPTAPQRGPYCSAKIRCMVQFPIFNSLAIARIPLPHVRSAYTFLFMTDPKGTQSYPETYLVRVVRTRCRETKPKKGRRAMTIMYDIMREEEQFSDSF